MPFSRLFHKKGGKKKSAESKEDSDAVPSPRIEALDENAVLQTLVAEKVYLQMEVPPTPRNSTCEELLKPNLPDERAHSEKEFYETVREIEAVCLEDNSSDEITDPCHPHKKKRSNSESNFEIKLGVMYSGKRKFGSEGQILPNSDLTISSEDKEQLDEAIGQYVDKLIRDSIVKAVGNVDVDSLCKEIVKGISNRKERDSESAESDEQSIVQQRLTSDSVSELIDLECSDFSAGNTANVLEDNTALGGYLADYEDTASVEDLKSVDEDSSLCSLSDGLKQQSVIDCRNEAGKVVSTEIDIHSKIANDTIRNSPEQDMASECTTSIVGERSQNHTNPSTEQDRIRNELVAKTQPEEVNEQMSSTSVKDADSNQVPEELSDNCSELNPKPPLPPDSKEYEQESLNVETRERNFLSTESCDDLIAMSTECDSLPKSNSETLQNETPPPDIDENLPQQISTEEERKVNWKAGYLHVKLPAKSRGKTNLKAWKKRCVVIQPDEFVNDPNNPSLVISVYGVDSRKHKATFWQTVSSQKAVVYRSSSNTHRYAFTISEENKTIIHLSADSESATQEWMAAVRALLWPPSPFMQLEKMLSGREFEISLIDNEFSYHAGLLGMYGYLTITPRKLILLHPQQGYVIQEWYLNTVDKFQLVPQPKSEDAHKVLAMTTCSESSTGRGEMLLFCNEAVTFLQSLASTIHEVLSHRSKQDGGKYQKELEEVAEWLVAPTQDSLNEDAKNEEHYKIPPRQVKSLLDIPNFIFNNSLSPVASAIYPSPPSADVLEPLAAIKSNQTTASYDSGISTCHSGDDFLNSSTTSFVVGGGPMTGKSSDSELSDTYTPPRTPDVVKKLQVEQQKDELSVPP